MLYDNSSQHGTHYTGYSPERVGQSQQNAGVLGCNIQRVNAVHKTHKTKWTR